MRWARCAQAHLDKRSAAALLSGCDTPVTPGAEHVTLLCARWDTLHAARWTRVASIGAHQGERVMLQDRTASLQREISTQPAVAPSDEWKPSESRPTLALWLSAALAVVAGAAAVVGVFDTSLFHDTAMTAGNARGTDVVILFGAIPTLLIAMALAARGSLRAQIVWLGALSYMLYNAVFFAFATSFNSLFLLYVATLSLALWSLVALLTHVDAAALRQRFGRTTPIRFVGGYLLTTTALFALAWLKDIIPAVASGATPQSLVGTRMLTNPVHVMDLAFSLPLTVVAVVWLWRRHAWGYTLAGLFLVYGVIESASIATDQVFGHLSDPSASPAMAPVFGVVALIGLIPTIAFLRSVRRHGRS